MTSCRWYEKKWLGIKKVLLLAQVSISRGLERGIGKFSPLSSFFTKISNFSFEHGMSSLDAQEFQHAPTVPKIRVAGIQSTAATSESDARSKRVDSEHDKS